ncbi:MAG: hypothetical protein RIS47_27 [Bacteroidota bacterium]|jgi:alcohol dehydrogenase
MNLPKYYEFLNPVKIVAGYKALENLPYELGLLSVQKPLIITDPGIVTAGLLEILERAFDDSLVRIGAIFDQTPRDSSVDAVNLIARLFKSHGCDCIVALGGGSVTDTAKGVNILVSTGVADLLELSGSDRLAQTLLPLVVIPTTSGTGSEVTSVAVISDTHKGVKLPFASPYILPRLAILDPRMTLGLPPAITAATAMDALTHAVEAFTCLQKNPMSDAYALSAIELIRTNLYTAVQNGKNESARFALANASLMAGVSFSNSMVGGVHALGHALGAQAHVPHGLAMAILLPHVMQFNLDKMADAYAKLLLSLAGEDVFARTPKEARAQAAINTIHEMNTVLHKLCGHPTRLADAKVSRDLLPVIAQCALDDGAMITNPKAINYEQALSILKTAY